MPPIIRFFSLLLLLLGILAAPAFPQSSNAHLLTGAERTAQYLPLLKGKRVALLINQTSRVGDKLLLDTMLSCGINVVRIFVPEHGFRGTADAGAHIDNSKDVSTGLPVISLYGKNKKPTAAQLKNVDILVYDLQDVGVRFYTYISTLQYAMEACAENEIPLLLLDRPNPNGSYVDGPVLDTSLRSFVGMQPIPVVYGMTAGEYARMLVGERWFTGAPNLKLEVIPCEGWDHHKMYALPVSPSPNLRTPGAVIRYPSLCFFEGTLISVGRGTDKPFEQWGHPALGSGHFPDTFRPASVAGATDPPLKNQLCYGYDLTRKGMRWSNHATDLYPAIARVDLTWLQIAYREFPDKDKFFNSFFEKLAGTKELRVQLQNSWTDDKIRASWQPALDNFKAIRKKYLIYKD